MPTFDTPGPITLTLEFDVGAAHITTGDRAAATVEVLPADGAKDLDVQAVQQTKVSYADGRLLVKGPRKRGLFGRVGALDISVELPAGSHIRAEAPMGDFRCQGQYGECRIKASLGDIQLGQAETAELRTGHGDIRVTRVSGPAELTAAGQITLTAVGGLAVIKNLNGDTAVGEAAAGLRANSSNGRITVDLARGPVDARSANGHIHIGAAHAGVEAKTANGGIRVAEAARGRLVLETTTGDIDVGVRPPAAAWLDVHSRYGALRNFLTATGDPGPEAETVQVHARSAVGDIIIRRPTEGTPP
ncbi:DUF4097 family beta strand repeat-containing protein [Acrocarpospora catenulata]|uniref:DUF4097 family beta strand repeat-containing protein n=1 Tax=Acrocarpospora catenulata TaxID=2836182 RepID=UPI001BD9EDF2|nr:DUF4097 family beta strand repeat-containing protein [Acrocarpospora catenulata]